MSPSGIRRIPGEIELVVFADDAAKVNRVMDRMNLDFVGAAAGDAVAEAAEMQRPEVGDGATQAAQVGDETIAFETGEAESAFGFVFEDAPAAGDPVAGTPSAADPAVVASGEPIVSANDAAPAGSPEATSTGAVPTPPGLAEMTPADEAQIPVLPVPDAPVAEESVHVPAPISDDWLFSVDAPVAPAEKPIVAVDENFIPSPIGVSGESENENLSGTFWPTPSASPDSDKGEVPAVAERPSVREALKEIRQEMKQAASEKAAEKAATQTLPTPSRKKKKRKAR